MSKRQKQNSPQPEEPQGFKIWKQQLSRQLNCQRNDMKCWTSLLPKLACEIDDTHCWKTKLPHIPCSEEGSQCWRQLLPHLPCKVEDHNCWKDIKTGYVLRDLNSQQQRIIQPVLRQEGLNPMRSLERRFGGYVSKDNPAYTG